MVFTGQTSANPLGAVVIGDGAQPRLFSAKAREVISGGTLVQISGATGDVGSGVSSYDTSDLTVIRAQNISLCNGLATINAGSDEWTSVATRGDFLMRAGEIVSGGALVGHNASGNVVNWVGDISGTAVIIDTHIGRAKTTSASGTNNFALVALNV